MDVKHPETQRIATAAYQASGCKTHREFCSLFGDAVGVRTFRGWIAGEHLAPPLVQLILREFVAGWRPTQVR